MTFNLAMDKKSGCNEISLLRQKCEELEEKYEGMKEKHREVQEQCKEMEGMYQDVSSSMQSIMPEIKKYIGKLENQKTSEYKDINSKLSDYAQRVIDYSKGPLKPHEFRKFLIDDVFKQQRKNILTAIKKYSDDPLGVRQQLLEVLEDLQAHMKYRKEQEKLDCNFIKTIKKLEKKIEDGQTKVTHSKNDKGNSKQYRKFKETPMKKQKPESKKSSSLDAVKLQPNGRSDKVKQQMPKTQMVRNSRKRKFEYLTDSSSSQENSQESSQESSQDSTRTWSSQDSDVARISRNMSKNLKIDSSVDADSMSVDSSKDELLISHSRRNTKRRKLAKISSEKASDSGLGKDESSSSNDGLTMSEEPFSV